MWGSLIVKLTRFLLYCEKKRPRFGTLQRNAFEGGYKKLNISLTFDLLVSKVLFKLPLILSYILSGGLEHRVLQGRFKKI